MDPSNPDFETVFDGARRGDEAAIAEISRRYYPRVQRLVRHRLRRDRGPGNAWMWAVFSTGDMVQEVFLRVLGGGLDKLSGTDEQKFVSYLATVVHNQLVDTIRHHTAARRSFKRRAPRPDESGETWQHLTPGPTPSCEVMLAEQVRIFEETLRALPARERQLLRLRIEEDRPFKEIATRLEYPSADAARKAFNKGRALFLVLLRKNGLRPGTGL